MRTMTLDDRDGNGRSRLPAHPESTRVCDRGELQGTFSPQGELASLLPELELHTELDLETMRYHLEQSDATTRDGYWHASINEARSFLEALVISIALVERKESLADFRKGRETQGGLRACRRYLQDVGFLDIDEDILISHVYSIMSAKGSHFGVADEAWCRVARRMVWSTGQYLVQRYQAWKAGDRRRGDSGPSGNCSTSLGSSAQSRWRAWLTSSVSRLLGCAGTRDGAGPRTGRAR